MGVCVCVSKGSSFEYLTVVQSIKITLRRKKEIITKQSNWKDFNLDCFHFQPQLVCSACTKENLLNNCCAWTLKSLIGLSRWLFHPRSDVLVDHHLVLRDGSRWKHIPDFWPFFWQHGCIKLQRRLVRVLACTAMACEVTSKVYTRQAAPVSLLILCLLKSAALIKVW